MKENRLQKKIIDWLKFDGCHVLRLNSGMIDMGGGHMVRLCPPGTPDLLAIVPPYGRALFLEVKRDKKIADHWNKVVESFVAGGTVAKSNKPIIDQYKQIVKIWDSGACAAVVCSIKDVQDILTQIKNEKSRCSCGGGIAV